MSSVYGMNLMSGSKRISFNSSTLHDDHPEDQVEDIIPGLPPLPFKDFNYEIFHINPSSPVVQILSSNGTKNSTSIWVVWNSYEEL